MANRSGGSSSPARGRRRGTGSRRSWHSNLATAATIGLAATLLSACGDSGKPVLNWYVNPDGVATFEKWAEKCSTDDYDIAVQLLPSSATDQRIQLARRLAAEDDSTDIMNLDPVFVAEFANAGWLAEIPEDHWQEIEGDVLEGPAETVTWEDSVYALPLWANTQVLWYRKSLADKAGLDMTQPVTWEQVINAAADNGGTVGVQANKYEAYVVWINALVQGAGGEIVADTEEGRDASVEIDSDAGEAAARVIQQLADSAAAQPDLSVSNEGTSLGLMYPEEGPGEFMVNWTFAYKNYADTVSKEQLEDLGWARYPATVEGEASKPPVGGIDIGVGAYSEEPEYAMEAAKCITQKEAQVELALTDGLMPSTESAYEEVIADGAYPEDLVELWRTSVDEGGPRPESAFYAMISGAIQERWHSPTSVDPDSTPGESADYLEAVLKGESLL